MFWGGFFFAAESEVLISTEIYIAYRFLFGVSKNSSRVNFV